MSEEKLCAFHLALYEQAGYRPLLLLYRDPHLVRVLVNAETGRMRVDVLPPGQCLKPHPRKNGYRLVHWYKDDRLKKAIRAFILEQHPGSHDEPWSETFDEEKYCLVNA